MRNLPLWNKESSPSGVRRMAGEQWKYPVETALDLFTTQMSPEELPAFGSG
jgi:hypothetical protein